MRRLNVFNHEIQARPHLCSPKGGVEVGDIAYNLYIEAGNYCPAKCPFCPGYHNKDTTFDLDKLAIAIQELKSKDLINRISITGAEPMFCKELDDIIGFCKGYNLSINTSTAGIKNLLTLKNFGLISDVHVSRHHYDDDVNNRIFGIKTMPAAELMGLGIPLSLSCNLMKSYIGTAQEMKKYLDFAISISAQFVGFVGLMDRTPFCQDEKIDYEDLNFDIRDGFLFDTYRTEKDNCKCDNYFYANDVGEITFYARMLMKNSPLMGRWVFSNNQLSTGFRGKVLL